MKNDIVAKLNREFEAEIQSERQVVYILVETRKLLEQQNTLRDFGALRLCSDWAVHPKLDRSDAQAVLQHFDAYEIEYQKSGATVTEFQCEPLNDFMTLKGFRAKFIEALSPYGINVDRLASDAFWQPFIQHYMAVIQDCPLEAKENNTQLVTHVSGIAWPTEQADALFPGKCVIQWNWKLRSGAERDKTVCALI